MSIPCKLDRGPSISPVKPLEVREDLGLPFASDPSTPKLTTLDDPPPVDDTRFSWIGLPADVHLLHNPLPTMVMTPAATAKRKQPALHKIEPKVNPADNPPTLSNRESSHYGESLPSTTKHEGVSTRRHLSASKGFFPPPKGD